MRTITLEKLSKALNSLYRQHGSESFGEQKAMYMRGMTVVDEEGDPVDPEQIDVVIERSQATKADGPDEVDETEEDEEKASKNIAALIQKSVRDELSRSVNKASKAVVSHVRESFDDDPLRGFKSHGHFIDQVIKSSTPSGRPDDVMKNYITKTRPTAPANFANEGSGAAGGYLVLPDMADRIEQHLLTEESLFGRISNYTVSGNAYTVPSSQEVFYDTTGIQPAPTAEGARLPVSQPDFKQVNLRLNKIGGLIKVTDELLEDTGLIAQFITTMASQKIRYQVDTQIFKGNGVGQALGFMNSPALVTAPDAAGGSAALAAADVLGMYNRMVPEYRSSSIWMYTSELLPQLATLTIGDTPVWLPPGGLSASPLPTIFGRPAIESRLANAVNSVGDIVFIDPRQYIGISKTGGVRIAESIHLWFDYSATTFRADMRFDGKPWFNSPLPDPNGGSFTQSAFVALAARS